MRLKIDNNLAVIANRANKDTAEVSGILVQGLLNAGLIEDDEDNFGYEVRDCINGDTQVKTIVDIIRLSGIETVVDTDYDAFCECVIMGDGDCPKCGGELQFIETEGLELDDEDTPYVRVIDLDVYRCPVCGETIKKIEE